MANLEETTNMKTYIETEINLEKVIMQGKKFFGNEELANMKLEKIPEMMADAMVIQWSTMCRGEKVRDEKKEVTFTYPATWWEHFKLKKFPVWLLKKYPVKYKTYSQTVRFKEIAVFPRLSNYINFSQSDSIYFRHTEVLNNNGFYDCNMDIMKEN